tara:strand:+ start:542 stop:3844 length:3303 start_codon:yes stop_codon:yes gene_type:complete
MYVSKNSFLSLTKELDLFINKHYKIALIRGALLSIVFLVGVLLGVLALESFFRFSSIVRGFLFFGSGSIVIAFIVKNIVFPFLRLLGLLSRMSHEQAAKLLEKRIPKMGDQLLNVISLNNQGENNKTDLLSASIDKKSKGSLKYDFLSAITIGEEKKFIFLALLIFLTAVSFSLFFPKKVFEPLKRVVLFNSKFEPPNPFSFTINQGQELLVLENDPLSLQIKTYGSVDPEELYMHVGKQRFFPVKNKKNNFTHQFKSVNSSFIFSLLDGNNDSVFYKVKMLPKARIISEKKIVEYPKYTKIKADTFYDLNRVVVPEGSLLKWEVKTQNSNSCSVRFKDTIFKNKFASFDFYFQPESSQEYVIMAKNSLSDFVDSSVYFIDLIRDEFPEIIFNEVIDSGNLNKRLFVGRISDDYGFSALNLICKVKDSLLVKRDVAFENAASSSFSLEFDLSTINIQPGDLLEYYFVVKDNDQVNGPKESSSKKLFIKIPSKKKIKELKKMRSLRREQSFSSLQKKMISLNSELEKIKSSMLNKKSIEWEDKASLETFLKNQKKLEEELEKLKNDLENELTQEQNNKSQEILKKQEQINKMIEELMSDEMKKLLEDLNKLANEMNKEKMLEKLEDLDFSQENMIKELDRTIEHFKKLELEKMAKDISENLKDLAQKEESLRKKTLSKETSSFEKNKEQEKIKGGFNEIQNDLFELKKKNDELKNPKQINTEEKEKDINESLEKAIENLSKNKLKKANEEQQKSSEGLKDLAETMDKLSKGGGSQEEEDLETLRVLLEQLISFSLDQEAVLNSLKSTKVQDPNYIRIGQEQRKLNDEIQIIEDSLTALGLRQIMLSSKINKEVQQIKKSLRNSIKNLTERKTKRAQIEQQTVMMHTNELGLLLSEMMNQMQKNMPGSGQCNKPGGKNKKPGSGLPQTAEQMKKQIEAMKKFLEEKKNGKSPGKSGSPFEQLGRMAAEQAALKKKLLEASQELNNDGSGKGNSLKDVIKKIEEVENEIINNNISLSSIERQEEIKVKLLELEKAAKEQEEEERRESKESIDEYKKNNSLLFEEYLKIKQEETELLKTIPPNLKPYYKNKVNEYIKSIEIDYD